MASIWLSFLLATCGVLFVAVDADLEKKCAQCTIVTAPCHRDGYKVIEHEVIPPYQMSWEVNLGSREITKVCNYPCSVTVRSCDLPKAPTVIPVAQYPDYKVDIYRNCSPLCALTADVDIIWRCNFY